MSNGYIQINLGGKLRGIKFGMLAIEGIVERYKADASPTKSAYDLVYFGLKNNCEAKNTDPDFTYEDVMDWVDELSASEEGVNDLKSISDTFVKSRALEILNGQVSEEAKKKMTLSQKIQANEEYHKNS